MNAQITAQTIVASHGKRGEPAGGDDAARRAFGNKLQQARDKQTTVSRRAEPSPHIDAHAPADQDDAVEEKKPHTGRQHTEAPAAHSIQKRSNGKPGPPGFPFIIAMGVEAIARRLFGAPDSEPVADGDNRHGMGLDPNNLIRFRLGDFSAEVTDAGGAWRAYFQRPVSELLDHARSDAAKNRPRVFTDPRGRTLATAYPMIHRHFGLGWEIRTEDPDSGGSPEAPHRVFIDSQNRLTVFQQGGPFNAWSLMGDRVPLSPAGDTPAPVTPNIDQVPTPRPQTESPFVTLYPTSGPPETRDSGSLFRSPSWRHFFQGRPRDTLGPQAQKDGYRRVRSVLVSRQGFRLAEMTPITDARYGDGWEIQPESHEGSGQDYRDIGRHRIFVDSDGSMTVLVPSQHGGWTKLQGNTLAPFDAMDHVSPPVTPPAPRSPYGVNDGSLLRRYPTASSAPRLVAAPTGGQNFQSWHEYFVEANNSELRLAAVGDATAGRALVIGPSYPPLARATPLRHTLLGVGWEVSPEPQASAPSDSDATHRIFFGPDDRMTVFRLSDAGWVERPAHEFLADQDAPPEKPSEDPDPKLGLVTPDDFQTFNFDPHGMFESSNMITHHPTNGEVERHNPSIEGGYASWREFPQDRDWSNAQMRLFAQKNSNRILNVSSSGSGSHVLAKGYPISHKKYGDGWEFQPQQFDGSPQDKRDNDNYRVFINASGMNVFQQVAGAEWIHVGNTVPDFSHTRTDELMNMIRIYGPNVQDPTKIAISRAFREMIEEEEEYVRENSGKVNPAPAHYLTRLFTALQGIGYGSERQLDIKPWLFDAQMSNDSYEGTNYLFHFEENGNKDELLINNNSMSTTPAGMRVELNGRTGAEWNKIMLVNALRLAAQARGNKDESLVLDGDPVKVDKYWARQRGYDYLQIPPFFRQDGGDQTTLGDAQFAFGYGTTKVFGDKFKYGAFSPMLANHQLSFRHDALRADLQRWAAKTPEERAALSKSIAQYQFHYAGLSPTDVKAIVETARGTQTSSVYEASQSVIQTGKENIEYMKGMARNPGAAPVSDRFTKGQHQRQLVQGGDSARWYGNGDTYWVEPPFDYQAHRTNYNYAYQIPQNTNAGILTAHVAGFTSVELDVMETAGKDGKSGKEPDNEADGQDNDVVVVHDAETNRNTANYLLTSLHKIEDMTTDRFLAEMSHGILDPTASSPRLERGSGIIKAQRLNGALEFMAEHTPGMTVALDARNDSPVGVAKLLADKRTADPDNAYDKFVATKVYPYSLAGGGAALESKYKARYGLQAPDVADALKPMEVIPALGGGNRRPENIPASIKLDLNDVAKRAPKEYLGHTLDEGLQQHAAEAAAGYLDFAASFMGRTRIAGIQLPTLASEATLRTTKVALEAKAVNLAGAATALATMGGIRDGSIQASSTVDPSLSLAHEFNKARLLVSDRFPDFTVAPRDATGRPIDTAREVDELDHIVKEGMRRFYYGGAGPTPEEQNGFEQRMRSSIGQPDADTPVQSYEGPISGATTNVTTDLLGYRMGITGAGTIPSTIRHHPQTMLKDRAVGANPAGYRLPNWTQAFKPGTPEYDRTKRVRAFAELLKNSGFQREHFDRVRNNSTHVSTNPDGKTTAREWFQSWRIPESFISSTRQRAVDGRTILRFNRDNSVAIPFHWDVDGYFPMNNKARRLSGWYVLSAWTGVTVYAVDQNDKKWFFTKRTPGQEAEDYNFRTWSDNYYPGPSTDATLNGKIKNGLASLTDEELKKLLRDQLLQ